MKMVKLTILLAVADIIMACQSPTYQASVADIVTPEFFNSITNEADTSCMRRQELVQPSCLPRRSQFGNDDSKSEIAAAFAHFTHETGQFCYIEEIISGYIPVRPELWARRGEHWVRWAERAGDGGVLQDGSLVLDAACAPCPQPGRRCHHGSLECDAANPTTVQALVN